MRTAQHLCLKLTMKLQDTCAAKPHYMEMTLAATLKNQQTKQQVNLLIRGRVIRRRLPEPAINHQLKTLARNPTSLS